MNNKVLGVISGMLILASCAPKKTAVEKNIPVVQNKIVGVDTAPTKGQNLYEATCASCHKLYEPSAFSAEEWKPIMVKMQKKAKISDAQAAEIYAYLTTLK